MVKIKSDELRILSVYIQGLSGIHLDESKAYLLENRLGGLLTGLGCTSFSELYFKAKSDGSRKIERSIIDLITTGETSFFRDTAPFALLQHKILPDLIDRRMKGPSRFGPMPLRIWSAACSSGQEVYSIAIALKDTVVDLSRYQIKILGTDISDAAVAKASYGQYNKFEIERGLMPDKISRYFSAEKDVWKVKDEIRALATFRKMNLMENFNGVGKFDIVFCRNVAIYFKEDDRKRLFERISSVLEPDGYLIIGSTESLTGISQRFEPKRYLRSIFYQLKGFSG